MKMDTVTYASDTVPSVSGIEVFIYLHALSICAYIEIQLGTGGRKSSPRTPSVSSAGEAHRKHLLAVIEAFIHFHALPICARGSHENVCSHLEIFRDMFRHFDTFSYIFIHFQTLGKTTLTFWGPKKHVYLG